MPNIIGIDARTMFRQRVGIGQYTYNLVKHLARSLDDTTFHLYTDTGTRETIDASNIEIIKLGFDLKGFKRLRKIYSPLWMNMTLPRYLHRQTDIFHSPNFILPSAISCKCVVTVHDLIFLKHPETYDYFYPKYLRNFVLKSLKKADKIIVVSKTTKNDLLELMHIEEEKIQVIYNGVSNEFVHLEDKDRLEKKARELNIPKNILLYVGTIETRKNLGVLLRAFRELKIKHRIPHKLLLVGKKGHGWKEIYDLVLKLNIADDVIFYGYAPQDALVYLYNLAEIFIYPSIYEGFGLPVFEAMACGTPVIASNTSSIKEVAEDSAILVNSDSPEEFAGGIESVLSNDDVRTALIKSGLNRVKNLNWDHASEMVVQLYRELLEL